MATDNSSFDRLVAGLSSEERFSLLRKLEAGLDVDKETLAIHSSESKAPAVNLEKAFQKESVLVRLWIFLRGLFSNTGIEGAYNDYRIGLTVKKIVADSPNLIEPRYLALENSFYEKLLKLQDAAKFFKNGIAAYEHDEGGFCIFLTTLVMPDFGERMEKEVSPHSLPPTSEPSPELRTSLIRNMENILADIGSDDKASLHDCFACLDWLRRFVALPFSHFISLFRSIPEKGMSCAISAAQTEIAQFSKVLYNAKKILPEVLESLYMFSVEEKIGAGEKVDVETGLSGFLQDSMRHITYIKYFIQSVPMRQLGCIAFNSALWTPEVQEFSDSWFTRCKNQWRKIFDEQWALWIHSRKISQTKQLAAALFNISDYPFLPHRPWQTSKVRLICKRDYCAGFLYAFFPSMYNDFIPFLDIVIVDGKFIVPENRIEFTDTYNEMKHLGELLIAFNEKLSPTGIYGQAFNSVGTVQTVQEQETAKNLMRSIESEINLFITVFSGSCRSFKMLFDGMLVDVRNIKYDSLSNLASLTDKDGMPIRSKLVEISQKLDTAFQLLKDIEEMENDIP
ncbi:DUF5312 family protein [Treponema sp. HNW]|uniref:DUF5312 family protein n=1 Tax=Treponema sp. HNW TaxID=3116654 RepID=UPI003D1036C3